MVSMTSSLQSNTKAPPEHAVTISVDVTGGELEVRQPGILTALINRSHLLWWSRFRIPMTLDFVFFNLPNPSGRYIDFGFSQLP
jgi:hypothetical protein